MTLYEIVGANLRRLRESRGLTLEVAGRSLRIDPSQLSKMERGIGGSELGTYGRIADFYSVQTVDLFRLPASNPRQPKNGSSSVASR